MSKAPIYKSIDAFDKEIESKRVVFTNGCFDILHAGHISCLEASKELGDILFVGLNTDDSIKRLKGNERPINAWADRALVLSSLRCVDYIIGFDEDTPIDLIKALKPNIITKGGDYRASEMIGSSFVTSYGGEVIILPYVDGYSTTDIIKNDNEQPNQINNRIAHIALVVDDYDDAIAFYTQKLDFNLLEDTKLSEDKRWVLIAPPGAQECSLLLAKAANDQQSKSVGNQSGGRVFLFLFTEDFERDYKKLKSRNVKFVRPAQDYNYGKVAVFEDLYGNMWDLLQPSPKNKGWIKPRG